MERPPTIEESFAPGESPVPASDARPPRRSDTLARDGALTGGLEGEAKARSRYRSRMRVLLLLVVSTAVGGRRFTVEDVKGEDAASLSRALARAKGVYVTSEGRETARRRPARATAYASLARDTVLVVAFNLGYVRFLENFASWCWLQIRPVLEEFPSSCPRHSPALIDTALSLCLRQSLPAPHRPV